MAPVSCIIQQSSYVNPPVDPTEQDELAGAQGGRSDADNNKASTSPKAYTLPLILFSSKDLFTKFMKVFMKLTQAQVLAKLRKRPLKARTPKTYWGKFHMENYYFHQEYDNYFRTSGATKTNCTSFAASFLCGSISLRCTQYNCRHKIATLIT